VIEEGEKVLFINLEEEAWRREELNIRSRSESVEEDKKDILEEYQDFVRAHSVRHQSHFNIVEKAS